MKRNFIILVLLIAITTTLLSSDKKIVLIPIYNDTEDITNILIKELEISYKNSITLDANLNYKAISNIAALDNLKQKKIDIVLVGYYGAVDNSEFISIRGVALENREDIFAYNITTTKLSLKNDLTKLASDISKAVEAPTKKKNSPDSAILLTSIDKNVTDNEIVNNSNVIKNLFIKEVLGSRDYTILEAVGNIPTNIDEKKAIEIGKTSNAKAVFVLNIDNDNSEYLISINGFDTSKGNLIASTYSIVDKKNVISKVKELGMELANASVTEPAEENIITNETVNKEIEPAISKKYEWIANLWDISLNDNKAMKNIYSSSIFYANLFLGIGLGVSITGTLLMTIPISAYSINYYNYQNDYNYTYVHVLMGIFGTLTGIGVVIALVSIIPYVLADGLKKAYNEINKKSIKLKEISLNYDYKNEKICSSIAFSF